MNSFKDFNFELKEPLDLPDNIVCYVDDISVPRTWRTIESHNNKFYIIVKMEYLKGLGTAYNWGPVCFNFPEGNYTGANLATAIQDLLNGFAVTFDFEVLNRPARGTITIEAKSEGMDSHNKLYKPNDFGKVTWMSSTDSDYPWKDNEGNVRTVEIHDIRSINGVLRNSDMITVNLES